jgi:hypothetical protein
MTETVKIFVDADEFTSVCSDAISVLNNQEALHVEAAALSRLLYRMKSKLRCDKGFKFMAKVGTLYPGCYPANLMSLMRSLYR